MRWTRENGEFRYYDGPFLMGRILPANGGSSKAIAFTGGHGPYKPNHAEKNGAQVRDLKKWVERTVANTKIL